MGKSMLIIVASLFLVFSITQLGVFQRQSDIDGITIAYVHQSQARNAANSGLERALKHIGEVDSWRVPPDAPVVYSFGDDQASVVVVDEDTPGETLPPRVIEIRSTGSSGGETALAIARIQVSGGLPPMSGAMSIYGENIDMRFNGNSFLISGFDVNPDNTPGSEDALPGITNNTSAGQASVISSLSPQQEDNVVGAGMTSPSVGLDLQMDPADLEDFVNQALANADEVCATGNTKCDKDFDAGTPDAPKIMVIQNGGKFNLDKGPAAGVIIVQEGGELDLTGNPNYQGLIIVMGTVKMVTGTPKIFGGMIFSGPSPVLEVDEEVDIIVGGNAHIQYSSAVMENITDKLPVGTAKRQQLTYIMD